MDDFGNFSCEDIFENGTRMLSAAHRNSSNITDVGPVPVEFRYFWLCSVESYLQAQVCAAQMKFGVILSLRNHHCAK